MTRTFEFNGETISISKKGYGQYSLAGLGISIHCTDSEIWDWCVDDENEAKQSEAKETAYNMLYNASQEL